MKYLDEFRDGAAIRGVVEGIRGRVTRPWTVMEVCGGQTHSLVRHGLDRLLDGAVEFLHGPGCPVCVTPLERIDRALAIARRPGVIFTSFGDMLRVPGSRGDLLSCRAEGADVRVVYSPLDAVRLARENPQAQVVFFAIGFETTAPPNAMALKLARDTGVPNFSALVSHVLVPPAMVAVLTAPGNRVEGFLGPGHVCSVMGIAAYEELATRFEVPIVVTGFEPLDLVHGVDRLVGLLEAGTPRVENAYSRVVDSGGNAAGRAVMEEVFVVCDREWRGIGTIPRSGLTLSSAYRDLDAEARFDVGPITVREPEICISGEILQGRKKPVDCPAFGTECTPRRPLGATMVSSEGACAAYHAYPPEAVGRAAEEASHE